MAQEGAASIFFLKFIFNCLGVKIGKVPFKFMMRDLINLVVGD
jgi:hypothetical protein